MFLADNPDKQYHALSALYAGFHDVDESPRMVATTSKSLPIARDNLPSPFAISEQRVDLTLNQAWWPSVQPGLHNGESSLVRSFSLGSYAWATSPVNVEECGCDAPTAQKSAETLEHSVGFKGGTIKHSGSMLLLLTKYETTLKSLGLLDLEEEDGKEEDTDYLFSRWGFHNGRQSCTDKGLEVSSEKKKIEEVSIASGSSPIQVMKVWHGLKGNGKRLPEIVAEKFPCMPWSWQRIKTWRKKRNGYQSLLGNSDDDDVINLCPPQRSYTDGHSVVVGDTFSFTDLRRRKRGHHTTSFSWGGSRDGFPDGQDIALLNNCEDFDEKKIS